MRRLAALASMHFALAVAVPAAAESEAKFRAGASSDPATSR
jgi:hypothetical protein